jgi:pyridoxamine 5'-phosphate oxidase
VGDFEQLRREYADRDLTSLPADPLDGLRAWLDEAIAADLREPHAMVLATAAPDGRPAARAVLLKTLDERGLAFVTNLGSAKSVDLVANPQASALFVWLELERQIRVTGAVEPLDDAEADAYFAARPREAQLAAWASPQSSVIPDRAWLSDQVAAMQQRFGDDPVPRPERWGGWRLRPDEVEFWQGRTHRLHDRLRFRCDDAGWRIDRLAP